VIASLIAALALAPQLSNIAVSNGGTPFAGDRRLLTTVSPNGDGFRDRAVVTFRLTAPATVTLEAVRTDAVRVGRPSSEVVWRVRRRFGAGNGSLVWRPAKDTPPRTYIMRLTLRDAAGRTRVYGAYRPSQPQNAPVVRIQGIDAGFTARSYAPDEAQELRIGTDASRLRAQVFTYGNQFHPNEQDLKTSGVAMTPAVTLDWRAHRSVKYDLRVTRAGEWASGLYFLRLTADDGRIGYAPFILRPPRLGVQRVAVVLATNTWQAYNFDDADGDGWGDSWYVDSSLKTVGLDRPFLDFGVPFRFRDWDLTFIAWLNQQGKQVDVLSDDDVERVRTGDELAAAYDLIVFPGHEEYVTGHMYDVVTRYRDLGGNLMFLAANNFFARVEKKGQKLRKTGVWRNLGRPEAALIGVQYVGSNHGEVQNPFIVTGAAAAPWAFAGTGFVDGSTFGAFGIEIDARTPASPPGTTVLAQIPNAVGSGLTAEMTYYETPAGARVFAAGAINFAAALEQPGVSQLVANVWERLATP
jgi:hypothetical protein